MHDIFLAFWFFLPAGLGNMAPIFAARVSLLRHLDAPIDWGLQVGGHRLLGAHKTWRGLLSGIFVAIIALWLQQYLVSTFGWLQRATTPLDYAALPTVWVGFLLGIGALGGDAVKSFFKRRIGTAPGATWFPFDQIDYIVGASIATFAIVQLSPVVYVWAILLWPTIHIVSTAIGYWLGLKDQVV